MAENPYFCFATARLFFQNQPVAGIAAVLPIAGFLFNEPSMNQIMQGAFDSAAGELQVRRDGLDCGPAV